ncbi:putative transglutaminase-like cysteine proteinase [Pseudomonas fluvialis]|uniref:Putative transglutaminase-like cysteine proteinase n=1 Tax=Pseudomonas fluvialis TaxID=1793966 RepID=A0A7X0BRT7_9PSED|nr:transglutaminase-like cysteine peptidase [Pseudomonas fluvialis]MBB6341131.1 putative transglutaminase-like cysteine proteinase [Pseudomonas fluvialis]
MLRPLAAALCASLVLWLSAWAEWPAWDFTQILLKAEQRYGNLGNAKARLLAWNELMQSSSGLGETEKLKLVNSFFNRQFRFSDDSRNWRQTDYWATPVEALIKGAGDCEDYSIAKYFTLRRLGVPSDKLRITYVKALQYNQAHMVLTYYASPTATPLVLDNLIGEIRPASLRKDLLPVYAFNAEGLYLPNGKKGDSKKLSRWQELLQKMKAEGFAVGEG